MDFKKYIRRLLIKLGLVKSTVHRIVLSKGDTFGKLFKECKDGDIIIMDKNYKGDKYK